MNEKVDYIDTNEISIASQNFEHKLIILNFVNQILTREHESYFQNYDKQMIKSYSDLIKSNAFNELEKKDISKIIRFHDKIDSNVHEYTKIDVETEKGRETLYEFITFYNLSKHTPEFFREMSLVYLVSFFEKYLRDILIVVITRNLNALNLEKQIKIEEIIKFNDIIDLKEKLIERELNDLFYKGIDDISKYLKGKFGIDLQNDSQWEEFRERFYKRNILIHNNGYPNDIYLKNIVTNDMNKIKINDKYLEDSFTVFRKYSQLIKNYFYNRAYDYTIDTKSVE
jgi:hypothetical protein